MQIYMTQSCPVIDSSWNINASIDTQMIQLMQFVFDKIFPGKYFPAKVPIHHFDHLSTKSPDVLLIFKWNNWMIIKRWKFYRITEQKKSLMFSSVLSFGICFRIVACGCCVPDITHVSYILKMQLLKLTPKNVWRGNHIIESLIWIEMHLHARKLHTLMLVNSK